MLKGTILELYKQERILLNGLTIVIEENTASTVSEIFEGKVCEKIMKLLLIQRIYIDAKHKTNEMFHYTR